MHKIFFLADILVSVYHILLEDKVSQTDMCIPDRRKEWVKLHTLSSLILVQIARGSAQ